MQEIIVYRNPAEAALWHAFSSGDAIVYLILGISFVAGFWLTTVVVERVIGPRWQMSRAATFTAFIGGGVSALLIFFVLF